MSIVKLHNQWPGGIPSCIRRHKELVEDVESITCAWRRFVREWVDDRDTDQQRRVLIERWATADQEFRDSYESRALDELPFGDPESEPCLSGYMYLQLARRGLRLYFLMDSRTQALLARCILSLFGLDCGDDLLATKISVLLPFEENKYDLVDNFKFLQSVARPDFQEDMYMTQHGTVLFANTFPKLIIDDYTLQTGLALWIQYETNGFRERVYRVKLLSREFPDLFRDMHLNQNSLEVQLDFMEDYNEIESTDMFWEEKPVDMRRPFTEIYIGANERTRALLEVYAPGYRESESLGNGLAIGYNLKQIMIKEGHPATMTIIEGSLNLMFDSLCLPGISPTVPMF